MRADIHQDKILIIDFGSQTTQLIARRVRELGVYCEIHSYDISLAELSAFNPKGIILSGGPATVTISDENTPRIPEYFFSLKIPILGICYGMQALVAQLGGKVITGGDREFGHTFLEISVATPLFEGCASSAEDNTLNVWMSHADCAQELAPGFSVIAQSPNAPLAAIADEQRKFYGVQFHPEVTHTQSGRKILANFVLNICGCAALWTTNNIIDELVERIKTQVGNDQVLLAISGGVDSAVVAALLQKAIGKNLHCVFVDNGLLRLSEAEQVMQILQSKLGVNVLKVDAAQQFLTSLQGVVDPEEKRKIIGRLFIEIFEQEAEKISNIKWLAQGTIYPDVVESAKTKTGKAVVIKSHHNVGGLPERMNLKLLEPLRELFKDEVRQMGEQLGLPHELVYRHPFPGPGLAVRVLGEVKPEYLTILRKADQIFLDTLRAFNWYQKVSQAFAVFIPMKSVAVLGDTRSYEYVIALRCVETSDFMTAHWSQLPYDLLAQASSRISNEVQGVSRVTYDISSKPPATIEWE